MLFSLEAYNIVYVCDIFLFIPALKARDNDNYRTCRSMFGVWHQNELYTKLKTQHSTTTNKLPNFQNREGIVATVSDFTATINDKHDKKEPFPSECK